MKKDAVTVVHLCKAFCVRYGMPTPMRMAASQKRGYDEGRRTELEMIHRSKELGGILSSFRAAWNFEWVPLINLLVDMWK